MRTVCDLSSVVYLSSCHTVVLLQGYLILSPKWWWMARVNATLQTRSKAHWTPSGISITTCEQIPLKLLTDNFYVVLSGVHDVVQFRSVNL